MKSSLVALILTLVCLSYASAEPAQTPKELFLATGGFFGPDYRVFWQDGKLFYGARENRREKETLIALEPTAEQWASFKKALDEVGVWSWRKKYERNVLDGTQWSVVIKYGGRIVNSSGSNAYPKDYDRFREAVEKLLGGRDF